MVYKSLHGLAPEYHSCKFERRDTAYSLWDSENRLIVPSDEGLTLETAAFESLYGGQFTLSTQLIKLNYLVLLPTDAAPVSLETYPLYYKNSFSYCGAILWNSPCHSWEAECLRQYKRLLKGHEQGTQSGKRYLFLLY